MFILPCRSTRDTLSSAVSSPIIRVHRSPTSSYHPLYRLPELHYSHQKKEEWPTYFPNSTLCPEWDLLQAIVFTKKQLKVVTLAHVKGHQDSAPSTRPLSIAARLNIEADQLAASAQYPLELLSQYACHVAGNPVLIQSPHGTITSRFWSSIRRLASETVTVQ